ncbi:MAG: hypothetical protein UR41_C0005G0007 [Candidatus Woesebacteria bacterium GW2011_GWA1_33_33]|nr:MAG: hypothetical protein UR41_C0005G0007 [Candidatus Woesebacteria bacterium GW2011_GWA1_33_33]
MMYCVKCRTKREGKDAQAVTMKNGKQATKAVCEVCGTKCLVKTPTKH